MSAKKLFIYINVSVLMLYIVYANFRSKTHVTKFSNTYTWTEGFRKCKAYNGSIISRDDLKLAVSTCRNFNFEESVWINDIMFTTPALSIIGCFEVDDLGKSKTVDHTSVATVYTLCNVSCFAISNSLGYCLEACNEIPIDKNQNATFCHGTNASRKYATVYEIQNDTNLSKTYDNSLDQEQYLILECISSAGRYKHEDTVSEWWTRSLLNGDELTSACDEEPGNFAFLKPLQRSWSSALDACITATGNYMVTHRAKNSTLCENFSNTFNDDSIMKPFWTRTRTYRDIIDPEYENISFYREKSKGCTYVNLSMTYFKELKTTSCSNAKHPLICLSGKGFSGINDFECKALFQSLTREWKLEQGSEIDADDKDGSCFFPEDINYVKSKDYFIGFMITLIVLSFIGCTLTYLWRRRSRGYSIERRGNNQGESNMDQDEHQGNNELSLQSTDSYTTEGEEFPTYNHTTTYIAKQENI